MQALARRSLPALLAIALVGGAAGPKADGPLASAESAGFSADGLKTLQQTMRALVDDGKLAGITTLVARHGKVVYLDAYGVQDPATKTPGQEQHDLSTRIDDQADRGRGDDDALGTGQVDA